MLPDCQNFDEPSTKMGGMERQRRGKNDSMETEVTHRGKKRQTVWLADNLATKFIKHFSGKTTQSTSRLEFKVLTSVDFRQRKTSH